ncbi:MAG: potassium-transporting ATPase subunit KdpC [Cyclobacteriaceae bacterium]
MKKHFIIAIKLTFITVLIFGVGYPLLITLAGKLTPGRGEGEVIMADNQIRGFELIGQKFDNDRYFNSRPSAVDYNAGATGGSNKGPTNPEYLQQVKARIDTFLVHNPTVKKDQIPVDLVTASGGGLDPHIFPEAAYVQVDRISRVRNISREKVKALVDRHVEQPLLNMGTSRVHVLRLNLALDRLN